MQERASVSRLPKKEVFLLKVDSERDLFGESLRFKFGQGWMDRDGPQTRVQ